MKPSKIANLLWRIRDFYGFHSIPYCFAVQFSLTSDSCNFYVQSSSRSVESLSHPQRQLRIHRQFQIKIPSYVMDEILKQFEIKDKHNLAFAESNNADMNNDDHLSRKELRLIAKKYILDLSDKTPKEEEWGIWSNTLTANHRKAPWKILGFWGQNPWCHGVKNIYAASILKPWPKLMRRWLEYLREPPGLWLPHWTFTTKETTGWKAPNSPQWNGTWKLDQVPAIWWKEPTSDCRQTCLSWKRWRVQKRARRYWIR